VRSSRVDDPGWAEYAGLRIPPDIAALLYGSAAPRSDGHMSHVGQPPGNSIARENGSFDAGEAQMSPAVGLDVGVAPSTIAVPPALSGASGAPAPVAPPILAPPGVVPRMRRGAPVSRLCGHCKAPGHTRKHCPALGHAPRDPNRNALEVVPIAPLVRRSAAVVAGAQADAPGAPELPARVRGESSDEENGQGSVASVSGEESDNDVAAEQGFDGAQWQCAFDSALPSSDTNRCPPFEPQQRRRRRSSDEESHGSVDVMDVMVSECNRRCAYHFKMGRSFSIDEAVIPFKGRHRARCYNPKKPSKYHFKKFSLNCADTGYVYCHYHYGGKDERRPENVPASLWPIKKLVDQCPDLHNKHHFCSTDNWYTSAHSLSYFRGKGVHCAGTIKKGRLGVATSTRPGFPAAGIFKAARGAPKRPRGDCMIHETKLIDGTDAFVTTWQDKKSVLLLSSYRPMAGDCVRKIKVGRTWTRQRFFRPNVVAHYNRTMGGTDLHDQRLAFARSTVKSRRWQVAGYVTLVV